MASLQDIKTQVAANKDVTDSAIVLLNGLHQALQDALNNNDTTAIQSILDDLAAQKTQLADAVAANTPAA